MNPVHLVALLVPLYIAAGPLMVHAADPSGGMVKLPQPVFGGNVSIEQALRERGSIRGYAGLPLSLSELSQVPWAAQGSSRHTGRRTAPSAGALYPLELYVVAGNVTGLPPGVYLYRTGSHELQRIASGDRRVELGMAARGQPAVSGAAADLVFAAVYERTTVKYGERGNRYVHMEAGHAAQNVYLQAESLGLGTVAIGAFDDEGVKKAAELTIREQPLYIMPIGKRK
jgi:SagB-type dehydrogenase family enzyme